MGLLFVFGLIMRLWSLAKLPVTDKTRFIHTKPAPTLDKLPHLTVGY
jgi:hypothetical protein